MVADHRRLPQSFYGRSARVVARDLLGKRLVRLQADIRIAGIIVETEAYCDDDEPDLACHGDRANRGRPTERTRVMFGPAGFAYVYFTYGMHWMFNIVTGKAGEANAVLIRALEPLEGLEEIARNRNVGNPLNWTNGPAKLAQALAIDGSLNGVNLCDPSGVIWLEDARSVSEEEIQCGPRIGLGTTPEPWLSKKWRFWIEKNRYISRR